MNLIHGLHFNNIKDDIYGGLTAAVVALPLAMAMGVASGVGPIAGIYGAIFVGFFASIFGGTPAQVSGPTGPMTVVMAVIFTQYTGMFPDDPTHGAALAFTVVMMSGLIQIAFGFLKLGKYIELVPHPVVSGFMSGIGVIIILLQLGPFVGQTIESKPLAAAKMIPEYFSNIESHALVLGVIVLVIVYGMPKFLPRLNKLLPSPLLALIIGTAVYLLFMKAGDTPTIGDIPTGFPELITPTIDASLIIQMIISALTLASLGTIDSLLTSLVADNKTHTQHRSNRELIGQGIGNTVAGVFGGLPGAGATMRTVVNINAGGRTPISGALHALVLLAIVLGAGSLASDIPKAVLAAILIKVGTDIIDWDYLKRLNKVPKAGIIIMLTVFVITVVVDLLLAVGVGMVMASFLFMHRMTQLQIDSMDSISNSETVQRLSDEEGMIVDQADGKIMIFKMSGPLSFTSAKAMSRYHAKLRNYNIILLDLSEVTLVDFTTSLALENIILDTQNAGKKIYLVGANELVYATLEKQGITDHLAVEFIFKDRLSCLQNAQSLL